MQRLFERIQVVSLDEVFVHEGVVDKWVDRIADFVEQAGVMKNPIVVAEASDPETGDARYVVLDGMHRVQALGRLGCPDICVYVSDYWSDDVRLESWDALLLGIVDPRAYLDALFDDPDHDVVEMQTEAEARSRLYGRELALVLRARDTAFFGLRCRALDPAERLEEIIVALRRVEDDLDERGIRAVYAPSGRSSFDFSQTPSDMLVLRPIFSKHEVLERTMQGRLFPRKSTRFLVPERPLRVDFHLTILKADLDLTTKNRLLDEHLQWCWANNRVRYYPEGVYVLDD
jgi:hypothetical protein